MARRNEFAPPDERTAAGRAGVARASVPDDADRGRSPDLAAVPIAGLGRSRMLWLAATLAGAWLVIVFVRQVGDVTAASGRADALGAANVQLAANVAALDEELRLIQRQGYIVLAARGYQLGASREVPFTMAGPLAALGPDAPGSAGVRIGAQPARGSPLESWLTLLFGPES